MTTYGHSVRVLPAPKILGKLRLEYCVDEVVVRVGVLNPIYQQLGHLGGAHVGHGLAQHPRGLQFLWGKDQLFFSSARLVPPV